MIPRNLSPKFIADRLGHADVRITFNRYGHRLQSMDDAALRDLENAYQASQPPGRTS
jgi:integrase